MAKITFTDNTLNAIRTVVQAIAPDAMEFCECNEELMEMAIDANRPSTFAGEEGVAAEAEITALTKEHGYQKMLTALSQTPGMCYV